MSCVRVLILPILFCLLEIVERSLSRKGDGTRFKNLFGTMGVMVGKKNYLHTDF